jgi:Ca2+-binding EF-hand superfamily protein
VASSFETHRGACHRYASAIALVGGRAFARSIDPGIQRHYLDKVEVKNPRSLAQARLARSTGKGHAMISRRTFVVSLAGAAVLAAGLPAWAKSPRSSLIRLLDTDNDGTVDLAEAKKAASALFDKLERDHDGTLDKRELARRLSAKELAAADPDHDGTLTKDEYLAVVEQRFAAADPDHDGTLDAKELKTRAGQALLRLLK